MKKSSLKRNGAANGVRKTSISKKSAAGVEAATHSPKAESPHSSSRDSPFHFKLDGQPQQQQQPQQKVDSPQLHRAELAVHHHPPQSYHVKAEATSKLRPEAGVRAGKAPDSAQHAVKAELMQQPRPGAAPVSTRVEVPVTYRVETQHHVRMETTCFTDGMDSARDVTSAVVRDPFGGDAHLAAGAGGSDAARGAAEVVSGRHPGPGAGSVQDVELPYSVTPPPLFFMEGMEAPYSLSLVRDVVNGAGGGRGVGVTLCVGMTLCRALCVGVTLCVGMTLCRALCVGVTLCVGMTLCRALCVGVTLCVTVTL